MDVDGFWAVVAQAREKAAGGRRSSKPRRQERALAKALGRLPDAEVSSFRAHQQELLARANHWRLWAAGYLAAGGMSDDAFIDFRIWLIHQGRAEYEQVLTDPDALVDLEWDTDGEAFAEAEDLGYVAASLLEKRGVPLDGDGGDRSEGAPAGQAFPEEDDEWFARELPRLWERMADVVRDDVDWDPDISELHVSDRTGAYTGFTVRTPIGADALRSFHAGGHDALDWWPRDDDADVGQLLPLASQLRVLTITAPACRDDRALAAMTALRRLDTRTRAANPLDLSALTQLQELEINDRAGLGGWQDLPLRRLQLTSVARPVRDLVALRHLEELLLSWDAGATVELSGVFPVLDLLVLACSNLPSSVEFVGPALEGLHLRYSGAPTQFDISFLAASPRLTHLSVEGSVTLVGAGALARPGPVQLRLAGARLDGELPTGWQWMT